MIKLPENMNKHITELDAIYADVFKNMTIQERINYCESLIDTTQNFLTKNSQFLNQNIREKSNDIIIAAQSELLELTKHNKKI
ncbi:MAG: hypothetical protein H0U95_11665 [Bacteroidetes bacterium]|nr:hypothetical protein [Bacteroidota bacterium]